ncbi:AAA family ATPase [Pseudoalteromonas tunicata]|uniref:AAA family ATPase n=1 Tax=Pseudoalteromonas tunicata TaxID=314281 RepID=UPI00273F471A|nr:AAA family ATPase [Pseudoalteromonas tunicata]MDP5213318.1 AAA family ATPase [Pseudoalteromonas tunicata]
MQARILPSRQALVDRIELQYEYGQPIISLLGQAGLGKSYLLETFLSNKYPELTKIYLSVHSKSSELEIMQQILEQSFKSPLIDQSLSLCENFKELSFNHALGPILLVIDNAQYLSEDLLSDIELLTQYHQVLILTASVSSLAFKQATTIYLEPLSGSESRQFLAMYYEHLPHSFDPVFTHFIEAAQGNPNLLLNWGEMKVDTKTADPIVKKHQYLSWLISLLILLVVVIVSFFYFFFEVPRILPTQAEPQDSPPVVLVLDKDDTSANNMEEIASKESVSSGDDQKLIAQALLDLTPVAQSDMLRATDEPNHTLQPLDIAVSAQELKSAQPKQILAELLQPKADEKSDLVRLEQPNEPITSDEKSAVLSTQNIEQEQNDLVHSDWFKKQDEKLIMLQLIALSNEDVLIEFLATHELIEPKVYQTIRNDKDWWVVTIGPYQDISQSQLAKGKLDPQLLQLQPFSKSIATINNEIARLKRK